MKSHFDKSCAIEIKSTQTNSIPASAVKPHQLQALLDAQTERGLVYKIPDTGHVRTPMDAFVLKKAESYVIACFPHKSICLAIKPQDWKGCKLDSGCEFVIEI